MSIISKVPCHLCKGRKVVPAQKLARIPVGTPVKDILEAEELVETVLDECPACRGIGWTTEKQKEERRNH